MVVDVAVVERHVLLLQVDAVRDQSLEDVALRAQEPAQLGDRVLQVVDACELLLRGLLGDLILERVDLVVQLVQHWKRSVDEEIDREVGQEGRLAVRQLGALVDPFLELFELRRRLLVNRDQVVRADEKVLLSQRDVVVLPDRDEDDREVVVGVLVDFRSLVLVPDVLDRQRVKFECVLQEAIVVLVGRLDVEPETRLLGIAEAFHDVLDVSRGRLSGDREQSPQVRLTPVAAAATPRAT